MKKTANRTTKAPKKAPATTPDPEEADALLILAEALTYSLVSKILEQAGFRCEMDSSFLEVESRCGPITLGIEDDSTIFLGARLYVRADGPVEALFSLVNELNSESLLPIFVLHEPPTELSLLSVWKDSLPDTISGHTNTPVGIGIMDDQLVKLVRSFEAEMLVAKTLIAESGLQVDSVWNTGAN